jgi:hypothetical protein
MPSLNLLLGPYCRAAFSYTSDESKKYGRRILAYKLPWRDEVATTEQPTLTSTHKCELPQIRGSHRLILMLTCEAFLRARSIHAPKTDIPIMGASGTNPCFAVGHCENWLGCDTQEETFRDPTRREVSLELARARGDRPWSGIWDGPRLRPPERDETV